jgi:transposase InsO family protein
MTVPIKATTLAHLEFANYSYNLALCVLGAGPFKKAQGGYTHILVAIDKFTKWIEYKPIASLTSIKAMDNQEIMFRYGIPNNIITDLGSNFTSSEFFDFCE